MPLLLLLKQAWERRTIILALAVAFLLALSKRQHERIAALENAPAAVVFHDRIVEKRVLVRGPVRIVKEVVKAPDGTVTTRTTTDKAPETTTTDKAKDVERVEVPPQVADAPLPYRYIGVALTPLDWDHPRASAGFAIGRHLDVGIYWDTALRFNDGAVGAEARGRF